MTWHATLNLEYALEHDHCVVRHEHNGPLRVLKSLYPEGSRICHNVLVHPPGGLVGGDTLAISATIATGAHALITTPGATRFYRSLGEPALQHTQIQVAADARLEWLPLEAILHSGCLAENRLSVDLAPGAEMIGWDITALGLPHADQPFTLGRFCQHIELPGVWLERGVIDAADSRLRQSPLGLAGQQCIGTLFFAAGSPIERGRQEHALALAREITDSHALYATAGSTCPNPQVMVLRVLAPQVEPVSTLLRSVWAAWRQQLWGLSTTPPRIWAM